MIHMSIHGRVHLDIRGSAVDQTCSLEGARSNDGGDVGGGGGRSGVGD